MSNAAMETFLHSPHWRFLTAQSPNRLAKLPNTNHISRMKMCMPGIQQNTVLTQDAAKRQSFSPNPQKSSCFAYLLQKIVSNLLTQKAIISLQLGNSWWQRPSVPRGIHEEGPFVRSPLGVWLRGESHNKVSVLQTPCAYDSSSLCCPAPSSPRPAVHGS